MKDDYSLNLTLCVGLGKCGMWEKVICCEISGVNIPHSLHHPILNSAGSHPLTSCDIRQGSLQVSSLLQRLRKFPAPAKMPRVRLCTETASVPGGTLSLECSPPGETMGTCCNPDPLGWRQSSAPHCRESNKDVPLMQAGLTVKVFSLKTPSDITFKCAACIIHLLAASSQSRGSCQSNSCFRALPYSCLMGGTRRNDEVHGTSGPCSWAGEQLFARVAAAPEMSPHQAFVRKGWRRNLFHKGKFFSCIYAVSKAILPLFSRVLLQSFSGTFVFQGFCIKKSKL